MGSANAHYGDHTIGVAKDAGQPGGFGVQFKIQVVLTAEERGGGLPLSGGKAVLAVPAIPSGEEGGGSRCGRHFPRRHMPHRLRHE